MARLWPTAVAMAGVTSPQKGVGGHDSQRAYDIIGIPAVNQHRILSGGTVIGAGFQHGCCGGAVGSQGVDFSSRDSGFLYFSARRPPMRPPCPSMITIFIIVQPPVQELGSN